jgi:hypothetical protein
MILVPIRMTPALHRKVKRWARANKETVGEYVRRVLSYGWSSCSDRGGQL